MTSSIPILVPLSALPDSPPVESQLQQSLTVEQKEALNQFRNRQPWLQVPAENPNRHEHHDFEDQVLQAAAAKEAAIHAQQQSKDRPKLTEEYWKTHFREYCSDSTLLRYLRAHNYHVEQAFQGLVSTLQWRRKFRPHLISPVSVEDEAISGKAYLNGFDKQGHPVLYLRNYRDNSKDHLMGIRYFVFNMEAAIRLMPPGVERASLIFDFKHFSATNSTPISVSKYFLHLFSSHYPERLSHIFACDAPWYFWVFFKMMSPFMHPVTKAKIHFVDTKSMDKVSPEKEGGTWANLTNFIEKSNLESEFKGDFQFQWDFPTYWSELLNRLSNPS